MKEEIKNSVEYIKTMELYCISCKNILQTKIQMLEKQKK